MYMKSCPNTNAFNTAPLRYESNLETFEAICEWSPQFINGSCSSDEVEMDEDKSFSSSNVCTIDESQFSSSQTKADRLIHGTGANASHIKPSESLTLPANVKFDNRPKFTQDKPEIPENDSVKRQIEDQAPSKQKPSETQLIQIPGDRQSLENNRFYTKIETTTSLQSELSENSSACGDQDNDTADASLEMQSGIRIPAWKTSLSPACAGTCWLAKPVCQQPPVVNFSASHTSLTEDSSKNSTSAKCNRTGVRFYFRQISDSDASPSKSLDDSREKYFIAASNTAEKYKSTEVLHCQLGTTLSPTEMTAKVNLTYDATNLKFCSARKVVLRAPIIVQNWPNQLGDINFQETNVTEGCEWFDLIRFRNIVDDAEIPTIVCEQLRLYESDFVSLESTNAKKLQGDRLHTECVSVEFESYLQKPATEVSTGKSSFSESHELDENMGSHEYRSGTGNHKQPVHRMAFELPSYKCAQSDSVDSSQTETECEIVTVKSITKSASSKKTPKIVCRKIIGVYSDSSNIVSDDTTADIETVKIFQSQDLDECAYASESAVQLDTDISTLVVSTEIAKTTESQLLSTPHKDRCSATNSSQSNRVRYRLTHRCRRKANKSRSSRNGLFRNRVEIKCQYWNPSCIHDRCHCT